MTADGLNSSMVYDAQSRLVSLNSGGATYSYDGNSLRVKKVSGSTTTVYVFSGSKVIAEYVNGAAPGSPTREYIYSGGALVAKIEGSTTNYFHQDHLSNREVTDSTGTVAEQKGHFPFGEAWYESATPSKLKFTSYERDAESGNDYAMARSYINRLGRFSSPDPISGSAADPQSLNRYAYVRNDPANGVDPTGLVTDKEGPFGWLVYLGGRGNCQLDGVEMPCSFVFRLVDSGNAAVLPSGLSPAGFYNGVPYRAVFDDDGLYLEALGGTAFSYENGDPVRILDLAPGGDPGGGDPGGGRDRLISPLKKALKNKNCAKLLGGSGQASSLPGQFNIANIYAPGWSPANPNQAEIASFIRAVDSGRISGTVYAGIDIGISRRTNQWNGGPFTVLTGQSWNTLAPSQQVTVVIHELYHVLNPSAPELSGKEIARKCGTQAPPGEPSSP